MLSFIKKAKEKGYTVTLLYLWLDSPELAINRVAKRVSKGGHSIPADVVIRRYYRGINNLIKLYIPISDSWLLVHNSELAPEIIARSSDVLEKTIINGDIWNKILSQSNDNQN